MFTSLMSCYEPDTTINQHQIPIWEFCFFSDHLKHIEERGMWYMRDSCSWDTRFVSGFDILRKLHLLFNNGFFLIHKTNMKPGK